MGKRDTRVFFLMINTYQKIYIPTRYHARLKLSQNISEQIQGEVFHKLKKVIVQQRYKHRVLSVIWDPND